MKAIFMNPTARFGGLFLFSIGGLVGWKLAAPKTDWPSSATAGEVAGKRAERITRHPRSAAADQAGKRVASIRLAGSPEARMRATVDLAYSLSPAEFEAWIDGGWFTLRDGPELTLFTKIVMERWKEEDEAGLLAWMLKKDDGFSGTLNDLAKKDPQRVLDHFRENPGGTREMTVLWNLATDHPDLVLTRFQEIIESGRFREVRGYTGQLMRNLAEKDPAKLAAALEGFPSAVRLEAESALSRERLKESFSEEIRLLWGRPDGLKIFEGGASDIDGLGDKILSELANIPPAWRGSLASNVYSMVRKENAEAWWTADLAGAGFAPGDIERIRSRALLVIGQQNPEEAVRRMGEIEINPSQRSTLIHNLFANIRDKDKARELVSRLGNEEDRSRATAVLDRQNSYSSEQVRVETPAEWLAKAVQMDSKQGDSSFMMTHALRDWSEEKKDALAAGFKSMEADKKASVARLIINGVTGNGGVPESLAGDAIRYLMENPVPVEEGKPVRDNLVKKSSSYVVRLSARDPAAATAWVDSLPAGETKAWTQRNLISNWRQYDPKAADRWEKSLSAAERETLESIRRK